MTSGPPKASPPHTVTLGINLGTNLGFEGHTYHFEVEIKHQGRGRAEVILVG